MNRYCAHRSNTGRSQLTPTQNNFAAPHQTILVTDLDAVEVLRTDQALIHLHVDDRTLIHPIHQHGAVDLATLQPARHRL